MTTTIDAPPFPPTLEEERGGGGDWITLARVENDIEAHLLTGRLEESGIETRTVKDRSAPGAWLYGGSNPWAPVQIMVHSTQREDARIVLAEISFEGPAARVVPVADAPRHRRRALLWWIGALVLGIVFTLLSLLRTDAALDSCDSRRGCSEGTQQAP